MNFTFGIITEKDKDFQIHEIINSIESQNILDYEIIIIGNIGDSIINRNLAKIKIFSFNENIKSGWITKKKNIIIEHSSKENIVFLHDYIKLEDNWYQGFQQLGNDFKIASNIMLDSEGLRQIDWALWFEDLSFLPNFHTFKETHKFLLPYEINDLSRYMYICGSYWVAKRYVMQEFPLDENSVWGHGEDVEWSRRVRKKYNFTFNSNSTVRYLKAKGNPFSLIDEKTLEQVRNYK